MKNRPVRIEVSEGIDKARKAISGRKRPRVVQVGHEGLTKPNYNLMMAARGDKSGTARAILDLLTNHGYYIFKVEDSTTELVQHESIRTQWGWVEDGTYAITDDNIVHLFEPALGDETRRLVVFFAPMPDGVFATSINRYFNQKFATMQKFIPSDTGILRIADTGGVKGAFYLDTTYLADNAARITGFIRTFAADHAIAESDLVMYGASKGGTGAAYHGMRNDWKFVAVDPIVGDAYYEQELDDLHFTTGGIYPRTKEDVFAELVEDFAGRAQRHPERGAQSVVVCSHRSPQFAWIEPILAKPLHEQVAFLDSSDPRIEDHPDVAKFTINLQTMAINALLNDSGFPPGLQPMR